MLYDEDRAEDAIASRSKWQRDEWQPDGMSAPPDYNPPEYNPKPPNPTPPHLLYLDPYVAVVDALRRLYGLACTCPDIVKWAGGTLAECRDALELADKQGRP